MTKNECYAQPCTVSTQPQNIEKDDLWIQCDDCDRWYHAECLALSPNEGEAIEVWSCPECITPEQASIEEVIVQRGRFTQQIPDKAAFAEAQASDPDYAPLIKFLESGVEPELPDLRMKVVTTSQHFAMKDGILVRKSAGDQPLIVVPNATGGLYSKIRSLTRRRHTWASVRHYQEFLCDTSGGV